MKKIFCCRNFMIGVVLMSVMLTVPGLVWSSEFLDTSDKKVVAERYKQIMAATDNVALGWTGQIGSCTVGDISPAYRQAALDTINFAREIVGVPAAVRFSADKNLKSQHAAFMLLANQQFSHNPPPTWNCYTEEGAAALNTQPNITIKSGSPDVFSSTMLDVQEPGQAASHRGLILYPGTENMGIGVVDGPYKFFPGWIYKVTWAYTASDFSKPRPDTRDPFVAWPGPGYFPYQITYPTWSFAYPGADFSHAQVTMRVDGKPHTIVQYAPQASGDPSISWNAMPTADRFDIWPRPTSENVCQVTITGVVLKGVSRTFNYTVTVFDPYTVATGGAALEPVLHILLKKDR